MKFIHLTRKVSILYKDSFLTAQ